MRSICLLALGMLAAAALLWAAPAGATGTGVTAVALGSQHTCALTTEGGVKCWGRNSDGQLGIGSVDTDDHPTPQDVQGLSSGVTAISAGAHHTCARTSTGGVKCWGRNDEGQLGDGSFTDRSGPVNVSGLTSSVNTVDAGLFYTCALIGSAIKCWGENSRGQLGDGSTTDRSSPVDVSGLDGFGLAVSAGGEHTCALRLSPAPEFFTGFQCWGANSNGELGDGLACLSPCTAPVDVCADATCTGRLSGFALSAGGFHTCAQSGGDVKCWGLNIQGQLGAPTSETCGGSECSSTPVTVCANAACTSTLANPSAVVSGFVHTCALLNDGGAKCWGDNDYGQLGTGDTTPQPVPTDVVGLSSELATLTTGVFISCGVTSAGGVTCWGRNDFGQLGASSSEECELEPCSTVPLDVAGLGDDADRDGCLNEQELGSDQSLGGLRDPKNFWDFYDVPAGDPPERDGVVFGQDVGAIVLHFGNHDEGPGPFDRNSDPLSTPDPIVGDNRQDYHPSYDRSVASGKLAGPADGSIFGQDISLVVLQFGDSCA